MTTAKETIDVLFVDKPQYIPPEMRILPYSLTVVFTSSIAEAQQKLKEKIYRVAVLNPLVDYKGQNSTDFDPFTTHILISRLRAQHTAIVLADYSLGRAGRRFSFDHNVKVSIPYHLPDLEETISGLINGG